MVNNMLALAERESTPLTGVSCGRLLRGSRFEAMNVLLRDSP